MAAAIASGPLLLSPSFRLSPSLEKQVCARGLRGAVNHLKLQGRSTLVHPSTTTLDRRRPRHSSSPFVRRNEAAGDERIKVIAGAHSSAEWEGEETEEEKATKSRRELLLATAGTFSYVSASGIAQSAPVPHSNGEMIETEKCSLQDGGHVPEELFQFEENLPMRVRRPAHTLSGDGEYIRKYKEAYSRMKALPDDDPRSLKNQWHIHHAFCFGANPEPGSRTSLPLEYSKSCRPLAWHRLYLYFHERILGELIDDPSFALPFWNWDNQRPVGGNRIPLLLAQSSATTSGDTIRNPRHFPPAIVNLADISGTEEEILASNLSVLHRSLVSSTSPDLFLAGAHRANQTQWSNSPGPWETDGRKNLLVGTKSEDSSQTFVSAGKLPMFCSHHSNVDRLWTVWRSLAVDEATRGGSRRRREIRSSDLINTRFSFYDQNKQLVSVRIKDALDTRKLRYTYQTMASDADWIHFTARSSGAPKPSPSEFEPLAEAPNILRKDQSSTFLLTRREPSEEEIKEGEDEGLTPDDLEETLLVKGVKVPSRSFMSYLVFINLPDAGQSTPLDLIEFVGMITCLPQPSGSDRRVNFRLSIGAAIIGLNIPPLESVSVTFVPRNQQDDAPFYGLETEWI